MPDHNRVPLRAAARRIVGWSKAIEWTAIVGSGLALLFALAVLVPLIRLIPAGAPDSANEPPAYDSANTPEYETAPRRSEETADDRIADYTYWLMCLTGILAGSTLLLWFETRRLARLAEKQSEDMRESIAAVQTANDIARQALFADQRAWIAIEKVKWVGPSEFTENGAKFRFEITIQNLGPTPATDVNQLVETNFLGEDGSYSDRMDAFKERLMNFGRSSKGNTLFPREPSGNQTVWSIKPERFADAAVVETSHGKLYPVQFLVGFVYKILGDREPHVTWINFLDHVPLGMTLQKGEERAIERTPWHGEIT